MTENTPFMTAAYEADQSLLKVKEALDRLVAGGTEILEYTDAEFAAYVEKVRTESWAEMAKIVGQEIIDEIKKDIE